MSSRPRFNYEPADYIVDFWKARGTKEQILARPEFSWLQEVGPYTVVPREQPESTATCRIFAGMATIEMHKHLFLRKNNHVGRLIVQQTLLDFDQNETAKTPTMEQMKQYLAEEMSTIEGVKYKYWTHPEVAETNFLSKKFIPVYQITPEDIKKMVIEYGPFSASVRKDAVWKHHFDKPEPVAVDKYIGDRNKGLPALHAVVVLGWKQTATELQILVKDARGPKWGFGGLAYAPIDRQVGQKELGVIIKKT